MFNLTGNSEDPSKARDVVAVATATDRYLSSEEGIEKLKFELHTMKGELTANTSLTKGILEKLEKLDVDSVVAMTVSFKGAVAGLEFIGRLEKPLKFLTSIALFVTAILGSIYAWKNS